MDCGREYNAPQKMSISIPRTFEYGTLHGQRDFADVIKLRILKWGDYPGLSQANIITGPPKWKREVEESVPEKKAM